jgi:hypothetical protein
VYHISAGQGKVILCTLTSAKQSRLDREDGKKCNGTSAMLLMTSAKLLKQFGKFLAVISSKSNN